MSDIKISKVKLRRGTNSQRKQVLLDQGELVYTTDTKRLYVGNGILSGGNSPAAVNHLPTTQFNLLSTIVAERGDYITINSRFYQLTGTDYSNINNWSDLGQRVSASFTYDVNNTLTLSNSGVQAVNINPATVTNGLKIEGGYLQAHYTNQFQISATRLSIAPSGLTELEMASTSFGNGISGGAGQKIQLNVDPSSFYYNTGMLSLCASSTILGIDNASLSANSGIISVSNGGIDKYKLASSAFGMGISGGNGQSVDVKINQQAFFFDDDGALNLSIFDMLTGQATSNSSNTLSSIFNGNPSHSINGAIPGLEITKFEGLSSNGTSTVTVVLSSAGFITFETNFPTKTGKTVGRFAIPIFTY